VICGAKAAGRAVSGLRTKVSFICEAQDRFPCFVIIDSGCKAPKSVRLIEQIDGVASEHAFTAQVVRFDRLCGAYPDLRLGYQAIVSPDENP
jgi:hypothetical protein